MDSKSLLIGIGVLVLVGGGEFGIVGIVGIGLLGYSTYLLSKQINKTTCNIIV